MTKKEHIEEFFKKLFELVPVDYEELNVEIKIPKENRDSLLLLEKSCPELVLKSKDGELYVTTIGLFTTFSHFFLENDETVSFLLENDSNKVAGIKII